MYANMSHWIKMISYMRCQKANYLLPIIVEILQLIILTKLMNYLSKILKALLKAKVAMLAETLTILSIL